MLTVYVKELTTAVHSTVEQRCWIIKILLHLLTFSHYFLSQTVTFFLLTFSQLFHNRTPFFTGQHQPAVAISELSQVQKKPGFGSVLRVYSIFCVKSPEFKRCRNGWFWWNMSNNHVFPIEICFVFPRSFSTTSDPTSWNSLLDRLRDPTPSSHSFWGNYLKQDYFKVIKHVNRGSGRPD